MAILLGIEIELQSNFEPPTHCMGGDIANFVAISIISATKFFAILSNIATKDQKKSFVASGGNIAKICVALMKKVIPHSPRPLADGPTRNAEIMEPPLLIDQAMIDQAIRDP